MSADSQVARVVSRLRESLACGELAAGERLVELSLAARLGVSRTPIRLALERLAHDGLLDFSASGGFTVRSYTPSEALGAIELRGVLEGTAARQASERLTHSADVMPLIRLCEEMEAIAALTSESLAGFLTLNGAFHDALVDLARNDILRRAYQQAVLLPFAAPNRVECLASAVTDGVVEHVIANEHHRGLVEAITHREGMRAESLAREHARLGAGVVRAALADRDVLSALPGGALIASGQSPT